MPHVETNNKTLHTAEVGVFGPEDLKPLYCIGAGGYLLIEREHIMEAIKSLGKCATQFVDSNIGIGLSSDPAERERFESFCLSTKDGGEDSEYTTWISFISAQFGEEGEEEEWDEAIFSRPGEDIVFRRYRPLVHKRIECKGCGASVDMHFLEALGLDIEETVYFDELVEEAQKSEKGKSKRSKKSKE